MADSEHIEVAKAYVTIVPSMEGSQKIIAEELGASGTEAAKTAGEETGKELGNSIATGLKATAAVIAGAMAAVAGAAVAAGKAFIDTANDISAAGDAIGDNAAKMGISTKAYQEWDFVLQRAGTSIDSMKSAMKTLANAAVEGNDAFAALGISQEQLASMSQEELFGATITALQNVEDTTTRTALASQLLGRGAVELGGVFEMTAEETEAAKQKMYELGAYMDEDAIAASDNYQDTLIDLQDSIKGLKKRVVGDFLPGITSVMTGLSKVFSGNGGLEEIRAGLADITSNLADLAPQFVELASAIVMSLLDAFGPVLPELLTGIFNFLNEALNGLVALIPSLLPVITQAITSLMQTVFQCLPLITSSLITLITDLVTWLASGDNVKTFSNGIVQLVTALAKQIGMVLPILLPAIVSIISDVATTITTPENIALILDAVLLVVGAVVQALANSIPEFVNYITGLITNIKNNILQFLNWISPSLAQGFSNALSTIQSWGANIKNYITNLINGIISGVTSFLARLQAGFTSAFSSVQAWVGNIVGNIQGFVSNCLTALSNLPSAVVSIGENLVKGLWNGISDKVDWVCDKIKGMGKEIEKAIKKVFGIASPSKVFAEIGDYLAQGLGVGFEDGMQDVNADMVGQMDDLTGSMSAEVNAYGVGSSASVGDSTTYNGGTISINVYGAEGQDVNSLADVIAEKLEDMTRRKEAVYGV